MTTTKLFAVLAFSAVLAAPAAAGVSVGASETLGSSNYRGTKANASVDVNDNVYVAPSFSGYRSDTSSGTFKNFDLRLGYETGPVSLGVHGGFQPKTNGYSQRSFGADVTFSITPGGSKHGHKMAGPSSGGEETFGSGLAGVDLGGGINHISHSDDLTAASSVNGAGQRRAAGAARGRALAIDETDLSAFAGAKFLITELSANITKSVYSKSLDVVNGPRAAQFFAVSGFGAIVQGFPDTSTNLKLTWKTLPLVRPYISYTHTTFKLGDAPSNAVELGGVVGLDMLSVKGAYERYTQSGTPDANYFTLGASLNF